MYDLAGTDSPNEFVEIFNPSETDSLNMDGWMDHSGSFQHRCAY